MRMGHAMKARIKRQLARSQAGKCACCGEAPKQLYFDHCHATGQPRALLCNACNTALGYMREDPERIAKLHTYAVACQLHCSELEPDPT
jgi:hypothetical protein